MRSILEKRNISSKEVYTAIGMAQANFSNAYNQKNGKRFSVEQMLAIAEFLGCSLDYMFADGESSNTEKYIHVPEMSEWTCKNFLEMLFLLRKSDCGCQFINIKAPAKPFYDQVDVTALYFTKRFNIKNVISVEGSNAEMLINSVIREWSQIIESTSNLDEESRELMLSTWEKRKIEQLECIELANQHQQYDLNNETKEYFVVIDEENR